MKKSILKVIAVLMFLCLMLEFTSPLLKNTSVAWISLESLPLRHNFYFGKRQWLADARTIKAAIRYLYQDRSAGQTNPVNVDSIPRVLPMQPGISTNLLVIDGTESAILLHERWLSRAERLMVRKRLLFSYGLPPLFAFADSPSNGLHGLPSSNWEIKSDLPAIRSSLLQRITPPANAAAPGFRNSVHDPHATSLQGA